MQTGHSRGARTRACRVATHRDAFSSVANAWECVEMSLDAARTSACATVLPAALARQNGQSQPAPHNASFHAPVNAHRPERVSGFSVKLAWWNLADAKSQFLSEL